MAYDATMLIGASETKQVPGPTLGTEWDWTPGSGLNSATIQNPYLNAANMTGDNVEYTCKYNCVTNGNFENGNYGFESDYTYFTETGSMDDGRIKIVTNWNQVHNVLTGPNGSNGNFLAVNGSVNSSDQFWRQRINVLPNKEYVISFRAAAAYWVGHQTVEAPANLRVYVDGVEIGALLVDSYSYKTFSTTWNSQNKTSATVSICDLETRQPGNDFAVDEIKVEGTYKVYVTRTQSQYYYFTANDAGHCPVSVSKREAIHGDSVTFVANPLSGYIFQGWFSDSGCTQLVTSETTYTIQNVSASVSLYALALKRYDVTCVAHDYCTVEANPSYGISGTQVTCTAYWTNSMAKFDGWYSDSSFTNLVSTSNPYTFELQNDITLFSKTSLAYQMFIKRDGVWKQCSNVLQKWNGTWHTQRDLENLFDVNTNYIDGDKNYIVTGV